MEPRVLGLEWDNKVSAGWDNNSVVLEVDSVVTKEERVVVINPK